MENEEIIQRRREKILARQGQSLQPEHLQENPSTNQQQDQQSVAKKFDLIKNTVTISKKGEINRLYLAALSGLICALLNMLTDTKVQFGLAWLTLTIILNSWEHQRIKSIIRSLNSDDDQTMKELQGLLQQFIQNKSMNVKILSALETGVKVLKRFKQVVESQVLFTFSFLIVHIIMK